jgi:hypothetical protein
MALDLEHLAPDDLAAPNAGRTRVWADATGVYFKTSIGYSYLLTTAYADGAYQPLINFAANQFGARGSSGAYEAKTITDNGISLVGSTFSGMRSLLSLVIGTNVQAWSANLDALAAFTADLDGALAANSDTRFASQKATKTYSDAVLAAAQAYAESLVVGLWDDRGNYDASTNLFPATGGSGPSGAVKKGDIWTIGPGGAGTLGGAPVQAGDTVRAFVDSPGQTAANWAIGETNLGYVPLNAANNLSDITSLSTTLSNLGFTTVGSNFRALANPSAISFTKILADNSVVAESASTHRTSLGLVIGTDVQAYNVNLAAEAGLTGVADRVSYYTGAGTKALATFTSSGRTLVSQSSQANIRTSGLGMTTVGSAIAVLANPSAITWPRINADNSVTALSATATFDALSPMTTLGDTIYGGASGTRTRLAGNITAAKQFLSQTGNGSVSAAPAWAAITSSDVTNASTTVPGATVTAALDALRQEALIRIQFATRRSF